MSYLTLDKTTLNMNKVVISLWFRIPAEAATAVDNPSFFWDYRVMSGVIPLIVWGEQQTTIVTEIETYLAETFPDGETIYLQRVAGSHNAPLSPSCVGVRVYNFDQTPTLDVHIQTRDHAAGTGLYFLTTGWYVDEANEVQFTYTDASWIQTEAPEYLGNSDASSTSSGAGHPEVTLDHWHHLLISWDLLDHTSRSTSAAKMWCAIDDVNKDGVDLPAMNDVTSMGPNDHMSWTAFRNNYNEDGVASISFTDIPSNPFDIPGPTSVDYSVDLGVAGSKQPVQKVEMADLQIFTGVTLDTSVIANRRAFIDEDGAPVPPVPPVGEDGLPLLDAAGNPVPPPAEQLLGQKPDVLLHGRGNWIKGINTGPAKVPDPDRPTDPTAPLVPDPAKQFTPTGKVVAYSPDPSLYGAQSPTPALARMRIAQWR